METYMGSILLVGFNFAPVGCALCNGQLLSIAENTALFSLLRTTFGGDGITTFGLPNLNATAPQTGLHYIISLNGIFPTQFN
jgi:microcystin-dependent protein